jgi:hypothetical protein
MTSVKTMRMGFLDTEDRLLMDFVYPDETLSMLATRRVIRRAIQAVADLLARSSPVLARVPASHKTEMLVWEHLSALQIEEGEADGGAAGQPGLGHSAPPWQVLVKLDIATEPTFFSLRFEGRGGAVATMAMSRAELHRLLASLRQLARHAEWDLDTGIGWLVEADAPQMRPGNLAS